MYARLRNTLWDGATVGVDGASVAELFDVGVDLAGNNPFLPLQASVIDDRYGRTGVPLRSVHPDPMFRLITASSYRVVGVNPPLNFDVLVQYSTPDTLPNDGSFDGWTLSVTMQTGTEHIGRSLPEFDSRGNQTSPGKLIGSHVYRPLFAPLINPTHTAISPISGKTIDLVQMGLKLDNPPINVVGFDRLVTSLAITFSKTIPRLSQSIVKLLGEHGGKVNSEKFFSFDPLTLIFDGMTIDESSTLDTRNQVQFEFPTQLSFSHNKKGWTPDKRIEVYEIDGAKAPVVPFLVGTGGDPVVEESFEVYERLAFADIFSAIDGRKPAGGSRPRTRTPLP